MFDITNNDKNSTNNKIEINSVNGILAKSTPESKIVRFHMKSEYAKTFFDLTQPHYTIEELYKKESKIPVCVIQVMLCGGNEFLVEFIEINDNTPILDKMY